jgi:hypothetical protein
MKKINYIFGLLLLCIGVLLILSNFGVIEIVWGNLWPLFFLIPGILFELSYFIYRKDDGNRGGIGDFPGSSLLVLGGIFITYGLLFCVNVIYGWHLMEYLWPIFLLGVAIGLLQAYLFGAREKYLLIPVGILGAISLFFLINNLLFIDFGLLAGILLVLIGIWIIFKKIKSNNRT